MNQRAKIGIVMSMLLATIGLVRGAGATANEETKLHNAQMEIDKHAGVRTNEEHAKALGEHFKVPAATILTLSAQNQGWGAVNIELALAWEVNRLHPQSSSPITTSLAEVERQRAAGSDWGKIAKTTDIGLAPVIKEARNTARTLRAADLAAAKKNADAAKVAESQKIIKEDNTILKTEQDKKAQ